MEKAGLTLKRVQTIYEIWKSNMSSPSIDSIQTEMEPRLAAFNDSINQNSALFNRIDIIFNNPDKEKLSSEQQRLLWRIHTNFIIAGAKLDAESKAKVTQINQQLSVLFSKFSQHQSADERCHQA